MKNVFRAAIGTALLAVAVLSGRAQTVDSAALPKSVYAVGLSANPGQSPSVAGTASWLTEVNGSGTYVGTVVDFLPQTIKPIVVNTNVGVFAAQKVATIAGHNVYGTGSTGISVSGSNTGWSYSGGGAVPFKLPKPNWYLLASVRFSKSTVSGATGYQLIPGVQLAWGQ